MGPGQHLDLLRVSEPEPLSKANPRALTLKLPVVVVQSLSCTQLFMTPWTAAHQASLSFTISQRSVKLMSLESMMPSNQLFLCCPLLLLASIFPSIRVFYSESALCIRGPKYWSFSFSISSSNEYSLGSTHYGLLNSLMFPPNGCNYGLRSTIPVAFNFYSLLETRGFQRENSKAQQVTM